VAHRGEVAGRTRHGGLLGRHARGGARGRCGTRPVAAQLAQLVAAVACHALPPSPCRDPARPEPGAAPPPARQHRTRHHRCRPPAGPHRRRRSHRGAAEPQRAGYRQRQSLVPGAADVAAIPSSDPGPPPGRRQHRAMAQPDQGGRTPSGHARDAQTGSRERRDRNRPRPRRRSPDLQPDHADRRPIRAPNNPQLSVGGISSGSIPGTKVMPALCFQSCGYAA